MFLLPAESPGHGELGGRSGGGSRSSGRLLRAGEPGLGAVGPLVLHEAVVDVALCAPVLQLSSLQGTLSPQRMVKLLVVVSLIVEQVCLAVALAGTATAAAPVQELLTASSSQPRPLPGLGHLPHLLVSAVVARAVSQGLQSRGGLLVDIRLHPSGFPSCCHADYNHPALPDKICSALQRTPLHH